VKNDSYGGNYPERSINKKPEESIGDLTPLIKQK